MVVIEPGGLSGAWADLMKRVVSGGFGGRSVTIKDGRWNGRTQPLAVGRAGGGDRSGPLKLKLTTTAWLESREWGLG